MAYQSGLKPGEFWDCTLNEVLLMIQGYRLRDNDMWRIMRQHVYIQYCMNTPEEQRIPIWDLIKLEGDPTEEEKKQMKIEEEKQLKKDYEEGQKIGMDWVKQYEKKGLLGKQKGMLN